MADSCLGIVPGVTLGKSSCQRRHFRVGPRMVQLISDVFERVLSAGTSADSMLGVVVNELEAGLDFSDRVMRLDLLVQVVVEHVCEVESLSG